MKGVSGDTPFLLNSENKRIFKICIMSLYVSAGKKASCFEDNLILVNLADVSCT